MLAPPVSYVQKPWEPSWYSIRAFIIIIIAGLCEKISVKVFYICCGFSNGKCLLHHVGCRSRSGSNTWYCRPTTFGVCFFYLFKRFSMSWFCKKGHTHTVTLLVTFVSDGGWITSSFQVLSISLKWWPLFLTLLGASLLNRCIFWKTFLLLTCCEPITVLLNVFQNIQQKCLPFYLF